MFSQQLAFPGAEGFGRFATGGRGGSVYHVTNLNDAGPGSFRDAVSQPNRIVVFDVGGVIHISSRIVVHKNITIAGQTAPGDGITIYGNGIAFNDDSGNSIIRHIRFRMGAEGDVTKDAVGISAGQNYIFDHVSVSWGRDGTFDINGSTIDNITIQDCIIAQGVNIDNHSTGGLMQSGKFSLIRTLFIDNKTRNPKGRGDHEYINNVVYNWGTYGYILGGSTSSTETLARANIIGSYLISGPASSGGAFTEGTSLFHAYVSGNYIDLNRDGILNGGLALTSQYAGITIETSPYDYPGVDTVFSAEEAYYYVLENAGASIVRDEVDKYLISELESLGTKGKIIDTETENGIVGNVGIVKGGVAPLDSDKDGIPDTWEYYYGLNPYSNSDQNEDNDSDGYTNVEEYLNQTEPGDGDGILSDQTYLIIARHSEQVLDIKDKSIDEGTSVIQNIQQKISRQFWSIANVGDSYYSIINDSSGLCIDVQDQSIDDSALIVQNTYNGAESQQWSIDFLGEGYYKIINRKSGKSLEVEGASLNEGTSLIQMPYAGNTSQHFMMKPNDVLYSAPFVSILSPFTGSVLTLGANIDIEAFAEDYDGIVSKVEFFLADSLIGTDTLSPYTFILENPVEGTCQISAVATDDDSLVSDPAIITITFVAGGIQENETGFCSAEGTIDDNNPGFTGDGFTNTENTVGAGINWKVNVPAAGTCTLTWRFANGSGSRAGKLLINNQEVISSINMPGTGSWTTWSEVSVSADLPAGEVEIRLEATGSDGLANIDYLDVSGIETVTVFCAPTDVQITKANNNNYIVYPNPFTGEIMIRSPQETGSECSLQLYSGLGILIQSEVLVNKTMTLSVEDMPPGLYFLKITNEYQTNTFKLIKNQ